jgi:hypothetical protein
MTTVDAPADVSRETSTPPPAVFVQPSTADNAARRVDPRAMPHDPDAPFGWMVDRRTGERRPKKTAGRQMPARKQIPAPRKREANRPRVKPAAHDELSAPIAPVAAADHASQVADLIDAVWMVAAAATTPKPAARIWGVNVYALAVRAKAQAALFAEHKPALAQTIGTIADKVPKVGAAVDWLAKEDGPGWILQGMLILIPFVGQSQAMWTQPVDQLAPIAANMDRQFAQIVQSQTAIMAQQLAAKQSADVSRETSTRYPGEVMLPMFQPQAA